MSNHLPECPSESIVCEGEYCLCDYAHVCCCDALRTCEERVARAFQVVRKDDTLRWEGFSRGQYDRGYADAIAVAVQLVESLWGFTDVHGQTGRPGVKWVDLDLVLARFEGLKPPIVEVEL